MAVLAHPDDESLGLGGSLARYAAEGIETFLVTATRGERGRYHGLRDGPDHPGPERLAHIRERELRRAAGVLGVGEVTLLDYKDQELDRAVPGEAIDAIAQHIRRVRPQVVVTFAPDGAYGHPDHIAICQFTTAAVVAAASPADAGHTVSKLYYMAWSDAVWHVYQEAFKTLGSVVDGVERRAVPWQEWSITTEVDARSHWETVWRAVACHESQVATYERLHALSPSHHQTLWGRQSFYRAMSLVNGGRRRETDLFEGLRA